MLPLLFESYLPTHECRRVCARLCVFPYFQSNIVVCVQCVQKNTSHTPTSRAQSRLTSAGGVGSVVALERRGRRGPPRSSERCVRVGRLWPGQPRPTQCAAAAVANLCHLILFPHVFFLSFSLSLQFCNDIYSIRITMTYDIDEMMLRTFN